MFNSRVFRVYTSPDILGIELGGALKNVIALAAGIADGLGYGDNTKAALITRGIAEIARLGMKMGGKLETFTGLTGIGDLIVTCASVHSRNRKAGYLMGQGKSMQEQMDEVNMVVEGVYSAKAAASLAKKYDVPMPIVEEINRILFEGKDPKKAVDDLMLRESKIENSSLFMGKRIKKNAYLPLQCGIHLYQHSKGGYFYGFISGIQRYKSTDRRRDLSWRSRTGTDRQINIY